MDEPRTRAELLQELKSLKAGLAQGRDQELYQELFQGSRDAITVTTRQGDIVDANPAALELFG